MVYIVHNALPILLAALVGVAILAARWRALRAPQALLPTLAALFWLAAILAGALILAPVEAGRWTVALGSAAIIWAGFVLPALAVTSRARGLAWGTGLADAALWLGVMLAQAAVLRLVGVSGPA